MSIKSKISEGQEVVLVPYGNNARYDKEPKKGIITKIRRVYFDVCQIYEDGKQGFPIQFTLADGRQKATGVGYGADWVLYLSEQDLLDRKEKVSLTETIRQQFGKYGIPDITLENLRKIAKILNIN